MAMPSPTSVAAARNSAPQVSQRPTAERRWPGSRSASRARLRLVSAQTGQATISTAIDQRIGPSL